MSARQDVVFPVLERPSLEKVNGMDAVTLVVAVAERVTFEVVAGRGRMKELPEPGE